MSRPRSKKKTVKKKSATKSKTADQRLEMLEEECSRLEHELQLYQALTDFGEAGFSVDRLLARFLARALKFFKTNAGTVFSIDPGTGDLIFKVVRGPARNKLKGKRLALGDGIAGWVAKTGRSRLASDVRKDPLWKKQVAKEAGFATKDILAVPIRTRSGRLVGVIELLNKKVHPGFTRQDLKHLTAISGSVGTLLENARLWSETRRRNYQLGLLNKVSHLVNSSLDPREVRRRTINAAIKLVNSEAGSLLLYDRGSGELFFEVALGEKGLEVRKVRLQEGEGIAGWVVSKGKPVVIQDCNSDERWSQRVDRKSRFITRDMICVPVKVRGKTIGAIQAINKKKDNFDKRDMELLVVLADQVAVALENARLFEQLQGTFLETSEALAEAIELRDAYTGGHTRRVTEYSMATGRQLKLKANELEKLRMAAILHDIGKLGVDDRVLRKPGRLDNDEFAQMKKHPRLGAEILKNVHYLMSVLPGIRSHHERTDGKGYPDSLNGKQIPLIARIIAVADTYDAMTSDRPYREGLDKKIAIQEIVDCSGAQFDPKVVTAFLKAYQAGEITGKKEKLQLKRSGQKRARKVT
ncbi:MAG: GAF domain-containing protein [Deltaproteobacteria bacterium]|nr:GAF domain-containing protein [Deltaproteobacteria bacterium]